MNMKTDDINFRRVMASLAMLGMAMLGMVYLAGISSAMAESVSSQNDQELQKLFSQLETAPDSDAAELVISQIWNRWMNTSGDTTTNEMMERGTYYMQMGELSLAEGIFTKVINDHPDYAEAWNKRATVRFMRQNWRGSEADIAEVLSREPKHFGALSGLGMIKLFEGDLPTALSIYEEVLTIHPYSPDAVRLIPEIKNALKGTAL
jgi:tetratricopeptide (TPR) repeat protein